MRAKVRWAPLRQKLLCRASPDRNTSQLPTRNSTAVPTTHTIKATTIMKLHKSGTMRTFLLCWVSLALVLSTTTVVQGKEHVQPSSSRLDNPSSHLRTQHRHGRDLETDKVLFVFTMGLEDAGHDLASALAAQSPSHVTSLQPSLHRLGDALNLVWRAFQTSVQTDPNVDVKALYGDLITQLRATQEQVATVVGDNAELPLFINLNDTSSTWSYPAGTGPLRNLQFPDLDLWYRACEAAQVRCAHVYLHRDPYAILKASMDRNANPYPLAGMKLYTTMLGILETQLTVHAGRTLGCWGLLDDDADKEMWSQVRDLYGWTARNQTGFDATLASVLPTTATAVDHNQLLTASQQVGMVSFEQTHNKVLELCRSQVQDRQEAAGSM